MSLTSRSALSRVDDESRDLAGPIRQWLTALCAEPKAHTRFLNTLSLLEHIGSRKIMASQSEPGHDTLKHLAEEARHAFFFKRAAEKIARRPVDYRACETLAAESARMYMGRLDAHIARELSSGASDLIAYLYMSLIVELRAIWFYRIYHGVLEAQGNAISLTSVLAEEELHLDEMFQHLTAIDPDIEAHIRAFCAYEDKRFRILWTALSFNRISNVAA